MTDIIKNAQDISSKISTQNTRFQNVSLEDAPEKIAADFAEAGVNSRESYLSWVSQYKAIIKEASQAQRDLRTQARNKARQQRDPWQELSQRGSNAWSITRLIEIRRASRVAARESRKQEPKAA